MDVLLDFLASCPLTATDYWNLFTHVVTVGAIVYTVIWLDGYRYRMERTNQLDDWIRRARHEKVSKEHKVLEQRAATTDMPILSAQQTRDLILAKKLDPKENVAFLSRKCHEFSRDRNGVNAIAEEFYDEGDEIASSLSDPKGIGWFKNGEAPPLFGVPISVKECIAVKGKYSTGGLACRLNKRMENDCLVVELLRKAGAIPMCTGNTVQIMMSYDCYNHIWGRSKNPWNLKRSPGGSSGGDAALVAMGCVPLAAASDVAGSIRIPACFSGVVGFKPTSTRLSGKGCMRPRKNDKMGTRIAIPSTIGPIARTVDDCALFMKAVCTPDLFAGDLTVPPLLFDDKTYEEKSKLKIGYFKTDNWFEPCATSKRALDETLAALQKAGHDCIPFEPPTDGWHNYALLVGINAAEGNFRGYVEALEGEEMINEYATLYRASNLPNWLRRVICKVLDKRRAHLLSNSWSGGITAYELWQKTADLLDFRMAWSDAVKESGCDAIVYNGFPIPATPHGISGDLTAAVSYMFLPNLLLWPAGVVPITTVRPHEQYYNMEDLPENQRGDKAAKITANVVMKDSAGLPIAVSVMTPAFQDEKCLRVMKEIETLVGFKEKPTAFEQYR